LDPPPIAATMATTGARHGARQGPGNRTFTEVHMSRSIVPAGVAALIATAITLMLVCVPMSSVWFAVAGN